MLHSFNNLLVMEYIHWTLLGRFLRSTGAILALLSSGESRLFFPGFVKSSRGNHIRHIQAGAAPSQLTLLL